MKEKVKREDILVTKGTIEVDCFVINGKAMELNRINFIDTYITHEDCEDCGKEFEKRYTYQKKCDQCEKIKQRRDWEKLPLVEWDGKTPLVIFKDDKYFFDEDDILMYCEDGGVKSEDLLLCVCEESGFPEIDYEYFNDVVHEDWEPSAEMEKRINEFNEFLRKESTNTWVEGKKRVVLAF